MNTTVEVRDGYDAFNTLLAEQAANDSKLAGIQARLNGSRDLKIMDHAFVSIKPVTSSRILLFESQDTQVIGIRNINNARPDQGQLMLLEAIKLLGHVAPDGSNIQSLDYQGTAKFTNLYEFAGFQNGLLTIRTDQKVIVFQRPMSDICEEDGNGISERGTIILRTPKFIIPDAQLEVTIELYGAATVPVRTLLKVELKGLCTQTV